MPRVDIGRYEHPEEVGWQGWISWCGWVLFVGFDEMALYKADEETGAVIGSPVVVAA